MHFLIFVILICTSFLILPSGLASMLGGRKLIAYEVLQVSTTFAYAVILEVKEKTPPPKPEPVRSSTPNSWTTGDNDLELLDRSCLQLTGKKSMHSYSHLNYTTISS